MDYTKAREELKPRLQEYVERITEKSQGPYMYICPICGSGTGKNHTGAFSINAKDPTRWKCFSCGASGDIFDLIGQVEKIEAPEEQLKRAADLFGLDITGKGGEQGAYKKGSQNQPESEQYTHNSIHTTAYTQREPAEPREEKSQLEYIRMCASRLHETDYHTKKRGISQATAERFMLGYDPHFKGTRGEIWQALIIPTGKSSYIARNTDPTAATGARYKKTGAAKPINTKALKTAEKPIFITEGELDALSIIEAGGEAIGLGGTQNIQKLVNEVKKQRPAHPLILALDNDKPGENATNQLAQALRAQKVQFLIANPYNGQKDANSALLADRQAFTQAIAEAEAQAQAADIWAEAAADPIDAAEPAALPAEETLEAEREEYLKTSARSHLQEFLDGIAESANTPAQPTGFKNLDTALDGGLYEGLYIIGAVTSLGKTTLALQIVDQIAASGKDVLIFSLEMARAELMSKSISRLTMLDVMQRGGDTRDAKTNRGITDGARYERYSQEEKALIQRAALAYEEYAGHIYIHEGIGDIGTNYIRETLEKHRRFTGQTPVVLVDYVQILAPHDIKATDKQNTDKAVLELKRISRDYKTPVIGISSFNRASYQAEVTLEAFKESGSLEYGSDVLIGLQFKGAGGKDFNITAAKQKDPREIELVILKNRNGRTGDKLPFNYYPLFNYFAEHTKNEQGGTE